MRQNEIEPGTIYRMRDGAKRGVLRIGKDRSETNWPMLDLLVDWIAYGGGEGKPSGRCTRQTFARSAVEPIGKVNLQTMRAENR